MPVINKHRNRENWIRNSQQENQILPFDQKITYINDLEKYKTEITIRMENGLLPVKLFRKIVLEQKTYAKKVIKIKTI